MARVDRLNRVMAAQYRAALAADHPYLIPVMQETDVKIWHFLIVNLPAPYLKGEFIFRLEAPPTFPQKPPKFTFLTPNGVFEPGGSICISIGEFHARQAPGKEGSYGWRASLGMMGFAREVVNAFIVPNYLRGGIRVLNTSKAVRSQCAAKSSAHNGKHFAMLVNEFAALEKSHPNLAAVKQHKMWQAVSRVLTKDLKTSINDLSKELEVAMTKPLWERLAEPLRELSARKLLTAELVNRLREALSEHDANVRRVLVLALRARGCWELFSQQQSEKHRGDFTAAFDEFVREVPGVCGGASSKTFPAALTGLKNCPGSFAQTHGDISEFLKENDIDKKAKLGKSLVLLFETVVKSVPAKNDSLLDDYVTELLS